MVMIIESIKQGFWWGVGNVAALILVTPPLLYLYEQYFKPWMLRSRAFKLINGDK